MSYSPKAYWWDLMVRVPTIVFCLHCLPSLSFCLSISLHLFLSLYLIVFLCLAFLLLSYYLSVLFCLPCLPLSPLSPSLSVLLWLPCLPLSFSVVFSFSMHIRGPQLGLDPKVGNHCSLSFTPSPSPSYFPSPFPFSGLHVLLSFLHFFFSLLSNNLKPL